MLSVKTWWLRFTTFGIRLNSISITDNQMLVIQYDPVNLDTCTKQFQTRTSIFHSMYVTEPRILMLLYNSHLSNLVNYSYNKSKLEFWCAKKLSKGESWLKLLIAPYLKGFLQTRASKATNKSEWTIIYLMRQHIVKSINRCW